MSKAQLMVCQEHVCTKQHSDGEPEQKVPGNAGRISRKYMLMGDLGTPGFTPEHSN